MLLVPPAYRSYIRNLVRICFTAETVWEKMKPFWGEKWGKGEEKYGREKKERNLSTKIKNLKKKKVTRLQFGIFFIFTKKGLRSSGLWPAINVNQNKSIKILSLIFYNGTLIQQTLANH